MNRRIAAFAIASVAVLGLTACSGGASDDTSNDAGDSAPAEETNTDQSVEEACGIVLPQLQEASTAMSDIDVSAAAEDPQATVDTFNGFIDALGSATDSVSNPEVKDATAAVYEDFVALGDVFSKVLIDQDMSAASDLNTITSEMTESATALQELCS